MKRVVGYLLDFVLALIGAALIGLMPAPTLWTECAQLFFLTAFFLPGLHYGTKYRP